MKVSSLVFASERVARAIRNAEKRLDGFADPLRGDLVAGDSLELVQRLLDHLVREAADPFPRSVQRLDPILSDERILPANFGPIIRKFKMACNQEQVLRVSHLVIQVLNVNRRLAEASEDSFELTRVPVINSNRSRSPIGYWLEMWRQIFGVQIPKGANRFMSTAVV